MNNDIKEIIDKLKKVANRETASRNALMEMKDKDYQLLLDYITKLQKEIEKLKGQLEEKIYLYNKLSTESKYIIDKLESRQ